MTQCCGLLPESCSKTADVTTIVTRIHGSFILVHRWREDGCYWNYGLLSLQREYVRRKFTQTAQNVYHALVKSLDHTNMDMGLNPTIVLLGCGPAPEMVAVKAKLRLTCKPS